MAKVPVEVTFETITPLWTGDAWGEMHKIRPSALIGSLRFWFEVLMYFAGELDETDLDTNKGRFEKELNSKEFRKKLLEKRDNSIETQLQILAEDFKLPISSIIFGTTGWRSLIEIKNIECLGDNCFGNRLNLLYGIAFPKRGDEKEEVFKTKEEYHEWIKQLRCEKCKTYRDKEKYAKKQYSIFYLPQHYFWGKFEVNFLVEEIILESIFYPLLNFMHHYGYWGGRWNIGYGRLKILEVNQTNKPITNWYKSDFELLDSTCFSWEKLITIKNINFNSKNFDFEFLKRILDVEDFYCNTEKDFERKARNIPKKLIFILNNSPNSHLDYKVFIRQLLKNKVEIRNCLRHICESAFKNCYKNKKFLKNKTIKCRKKNKTVLFECEKLPKILKNWKTFRHQLLGERGEGSKVLPYISSDGKHGFLSIAGLLNLQQTNKRSEE